LNKNQRELLKTLEIIANSTMALSDSENITKSLSKEQLQEVIEKYSDKITDFDIKDLQQEAYNYEASANAILFQIEERLEMED